MRRSDRRALGTWAVCVECGVYGHTTGRSGLCLQCRWKRFRAFSTRKVVCAWCQAVLKDGPGEETHGICPGCLSKQVAALDVQVTA